VGEVGSGKTLLLLSLLGETGAQFAKYFVGTNDCKLLSLQQLKQFYSFVPQEGFIMSSNLRDNVAFNYDTTTQQDFKIKTALDFAQFDVVEENMAQGLDTEIGERGVNLSGGQKQRVSIARVDFLRAPIIMLDDCFSALDVGTEEKLLQELSDWKDETILLSTHRLNVLKKADHIVFMKNGKIHNQGTLAQLRRYKDFKDFIKQTELKEAEPT
jgi:ABC-type bacteriocin/lantibiotic exporter with double-glycine peptidase domain